MNSSNNLKSGQKALSMQVLILAVVIVIIACIGLFIQKSSTSAIFNKGFKNYQRSTELLKDINSVTANIYKVKNMVAAGQDSQEIKKVSDQQIQPGHGCGIPECIKRKNGGNHPAFNTAA
ncbi:MAG: hypothetical protein CVU51_08430 [Deltaproteobacteria bacterium HGW-Deltaproteobacteria-1]|nr:MAG: hypothetical protein CVU51_08430 [Deltaproteobacteria bacterium HGW-Deltaproteobacteria-1]